MSIYLMVDDHFNAVLDLDTDFGEWGWDETTVDHWPAPTTILVASVIAASQDCLSPRIFAHYVAAMSQGWSCSPIRMLRHGTTLVVYDGHHRFAAARATGQETILAEIRDI